MTDELLPARSADPTQLIDGPVGAIELLVEEGDHAGPYRHACAVIAHPHPLHGGTLHNKVVTMLARSCRELGATVARFNFRGVGQSDGVHDDGRGEVEDFLCVASDLATRLQPRLMWYAGFSFGSYVAAAAAVARPPQALISVAPPVERYGFAELSRPNCPWIVIQGDTDEIVDPAAVYRWAEQTRPPVQLLRMPETGHFFHRRLMDLRGLVKNAIRRVS